MKWAEVIMVRSTGRDSKTLTSILEELLNDVVKEPGHAGIRMFRRERLETDICIVLFHSGKKTRTGGSPVGLRLVTALKEFGMVHHTIWNEMDQKS